MAVALTASSALSWLARLLGQSDLGALLARVETAAADPAWRAHAPLFLPYLTGERTPHNDPDATAMFAGLRPDHDAEALTYAVLEGVAFALADGLDVVREAGVDLGACALVGGGSRSRFWAQMLADTLRLTLQLPQDGVLGASLGAARLAMLAGDAGSIADICTPPPIKDVVQPGVPDPSAAVRLARYRKLYGIEAASRATES